MTADPLSPLAPGQPFPTQAARWNAVFEAVRLQRQAATTTPRPGSLGWGGVVEVFGLNDTGGDLREYRPVTATAAGGYELPTNDTAWQRAPLLTLSAFAATDDVVCVTLEAIPDGEIGRVAVLGAVLCDVNVLDAGHEFAGPVTGDTDRLRSGTTGPVRILHIPDGEGSTRRCVVLLGGGCCGAEPYDLLDSCLEVTTDCTGTYVTGVALLNTYRLADGSVVCVDKPPGDCCDEWWCTETGVVSQPIADRDTPPEGVVSGPYPTVELAEAACGVWVCEACPVFIPNGFRVELRNATGCPTGFPKVVAFSPPITTTTECEITTSATFDTGCEVFEQGTFTPFNLSLTVTWTLASGTETITIAPAAGSPSLASQFDISPDSTAASGYTESTVSFDTLRVYRTPGCDVELYPEPRQVGTWVLRYLTSEIGRFEVWLA